MAQSGFTPIKLYLSTTAAAVPTAANLEPGELALNNNDGKLFYEDSAGVVQVIATKAGASGDVVGPASATDNAVARYDGTTGKIIQNSAVTIGDDGATVIAANSSSDALRITQTGAGNALLVEDSANPDASPTVIDANGRVVFGNTSALTIGGGTPQFQIHSTSSTQEAIVGWGTISSQAPLLGFYRSASGVIGTQGAVVNGSDLGAVNFFGDDGTAFIPAAQILAEVDGTSGTNDMPGRLVFSTTADGASSPTERMRIDNAGRVGIGGAANSLTAFNVSKSITGGTSAWSNYANGSILSDVTAAATLYGTSAATQATSFTLTALNHFSASQGTFGASSTVTNQYGFAVQSNLTGATNNYGFYSNIASGTGRWNFYANGTADNYFAGNVGVGTTTPAARLHVFGTTKIGGILVEDSNTSTAAPAIEVIGKRSDANGFPAFAGKLLLARNRTDAAIASNITLGALAFGGNHTDGTLANILYSASIVGLSSGTFSSATAMPTSLVFYTGDVGRAPDTAGVTIGTERMRISETGTISLGAAPGAESLRVTPVASAVNYVEVKGNIAGSGVSVSALGSDTNISIAHIAKGTGNHSFYSSAGNPQFFVLQTVSGVNYLTVQNAATGNSPTMRASGSDTNVDLALVPQGDGYVVVDSAYSPNLTLTDAATIAWNTGTAGGQVATFTFVSSNRTMGAPTNLKNGGFYALAVIQNAGSNTLTWNAVFKWAGGVAPTLSTAAGAKDYFVFRSDGTNLYQQGISQAVA